MAAPTTTRSRSRSAAKPSCPAYAPHDVIDLVPAQRADVIIDLARYRPGATVHLVNQLGTGSTAHVMRIRIGPAPRDEAIVPTRLVAVDTLNPAGARRHRDLALHHRLRPPIHLHLAHFQVLSRNNAEPGPYDQGWKDTVELRPAEAVEIITRITGYPGRYVFHCHNLEHEDMAMMANLVARDGA